MRPPDMEDPPHDFVAGAHRQRRAVAATFYVTFGSANSAIPMPRSAPVAGQTVDQLRRVVTDSDKQRFAIDESTQRIRANQGHSVEVDLGLAPRTPPALLFHGTVERFLPEIWRIGLQPGSRQFVHLSADIETARSVGARRGTPVVIDVRAGRMAKAGTEFFRTENGVWLVSSVPTKFLSIHEEQSPADGDLGPFPPD
jgi:putative RNA 2'-phosphotransferase